MERTFGEYMRELRKSRKIKLWKLAEIVGSERTSITYIELGKRRPPTREKLDAWIKALGITDLWDAERIYSLAGKYRRNRSQDKQEAK